MKKHEFIEKLFKMYPSSFTQSNVDTWLSNYEIGLGDNLNYDLLFNKVITKYGGTKIPSIAWLLENSNEVVSNVCNGNDIWEGTVLAFKRLKNGNEIEYDFPFGGKADSLDKVRSFIANKGMIVRKIIEK